MKDSLMLLSVIIPMYNVEDYIEEAILSLIYISNSVEYIFIDDASTDNTILKAKKVLDDSIINYIFIQNEYNKGLSNSRNIGLKAITGKFVLFFDSDDLVNIHELISTLQFYDKEMEFDFIEFQYARFYDSKILKSRQTKEFKKIKCETKVFETGIEAFVRLNSLRKYDTVAWKRIYSVDFIKNNKIIFKDGIYHEDELWTLECFIKAKNIVYIDRILYFYRINPSSITQSRDSVKLMKRSKDIEIIAQVKLELIEKFKPPKALRKIVLNSVAIDYIYAGLLSKKVVKSRFLPFTYATTFKTKLYSFIYFVSPNLSHYLYKLMVYLKKFIKTKLINLF